MRDLDRRWCVKRYLKLFEPEAYGGIAMTISRLTLAAIMILLLAPSTHGGTAMAATVYPIVAFNDFYRDSKPTGYLLGASADGQWVKAEAAAGLIPGGMIVSLDR
jgi:hypothetical protein